MSADASKGRRVFWTYGNRFTEANAGGGNNTVKITPAANTAIRLVSGTLVMADTAAGRATLIKSCDEDGNLKGLVGTISLDNQYVSFPAIGTAVGAGNTIFSKDLMIPGDGSYFSAEVTALANTEWFDLFITWELLGTTTAPTVAHTSSGTASTGTASQNEVTVVPVFA